MNSSPPVIAVCTSLERARWGFWDADAAIVPSSYLHAVRRAGAMSVLVPPIPSSSAQCDAILDRVDGVLLIGGVDVDPSTYGARRETHTETGNPARDAHELALTRCALERDTPLLGICRGMQLLNVALGGSLIQHLDDKKRAVHRRALGTFEGTDHTVRLVARSAVHAAIGEIDHCVHCHHHQAVDQLGTDLRAVAHAHDGVVEAVESNSHTYAVGVQWHPEANDKSQVIGSLIEAAQRRRGEMAPRRTLDALRD